MRRAADLSRRAGRRAGRRAPHARREAELDEIERRLAPLEAAVTENSRLAAPLAAYLTRLEGEVADVLHRETQQQDE